MEGGYIDTDLLLAPLKSFTVLTDIQDMRNGPDRLFSLGPEKRVKLSFKDQRLEFYWSGKYGTASAPVDVIALTGAPAGDYWFNAKQLVTCLKALTGTATLGIASGGMLTLSHPGRLLHAKRHAAAENRRKPLRLLLRKRRKEGCLWRDSDDLPLLRRHSPSCSRCERSTVRQRRQKKTGH